MPGDDRAALYLMPRPTVAVFSVPHTGTYFTAGLLGCPALHLSPDGFELAQSFNGVVVVPLRHPVRVAESWKARGKPLSVLREYWLRIPKLANPAFLPVDSPDRDEWLRRLSQRTGRALSTDWRAINRCGRHIKLNETERALALSLPLLARY